MSAITLNNVSKAFGKVTTVQNFSLEVLDGEFLVLLGPSGCGKTTILRILAGLYEPSTGSVFIDDVDVTDDAPAQRNLAMVFQSYALYPHLKVRANIAYPLKAIGVRKAERATVVARVATMLGLEELLDRLPRELSGGQKQRVALARALVREPRAFLMDEPLSNLDAALRSATREEITGLHRQLKRTFVYVTHDQVEAMTMGTRIVVMNNGGIEQIGTPAEVYDTPATEFVARFMGTPSMNLTAATIHDAGDEICLAGGQITGRFHPGYIAATSVTVGVRPEHLMIVDDAPGDGPIRGLRITTQIERVENLGPEQLVAFRVDGSRWQARLPRSTVVKEGEAVDFIADLDKVHLFNPETGRRYDLAPDKQPTDFKISRLVAGHGSRATQSVIQNS